MNDDVIEERGRREVRRREVDFETIREGNSRERAGKDERRQERYVNPYDEIVVGGGKGGMEAMGEVEHLERDSRGESRRERGARGNSRGKKEPRAASRGSLQSGRGREDERGQEKEEEVDEDEGGIIEEAPLNEHEKKAIKNTGKTFEQLLEEQLALGGDPGMAPSTSSTIKQKEVAVSEDLSDSLGGKKHTFLKKNSRPVGPLRVKKKGPVDGIEEGQEHEEEEGPTTTNNNNSSINTRKNVMTKKSSNKNMSMTSPPRLDVVNKKKGPKEKDKSLEEGMERASESKVSVKEDESSTRGEIEREMKKLKDEKDKLKVKERKVNEEAKALAKEREDFSRFMKEEGEKLDAAKEEELKKTKKEKKVVERNLKAATVAETRKEREEIEALKEKIRRIEEEAREKDKKNKFAAERQKKQIEELLQRNKELEEAVHRLETTLSNPAQPGLATFKIPNMVTDEKGKSPKKSIANNEEAKSAEKAKGGIKAEKAGKKGKGVSSKKEPDKIFGGVNELEDDEFEKIESEAVEDHWEENSDGSKEITESAKKTKMNINPDEYAYSANVYYQEYLLNKKKSSNITLPIEKQPKVVNKTEENGKLQVTYEDGKKEVVFKNGAKREIYPNGYIIVNYTIGDIKQTLPDNSIIYYYADADTTQITLPDNGLNIYRFSSNQVEFHYEDGSKEIK